MTRIYPVRRMIYQRDGEVYVVTYPANRPELALRTVGGWAGNRELAFDWLDAFRVTGGVRRHAANDFGLVH